MAIITDVDLKNNIAEYLQAVENGEEFIVTKNGKKIGTFAPTDNVTDENFVGVKNEYLKNKYGIDGENSITASLIGILKNDEDYKNAKDEILREKYEIAY